MADFVSRSAAVRWRCERAPAHDRGALLVHLLLVLAGGGEACTDIEHMRSQRDLFGAVGSHSTLHRALRGIDGSELGALWGAAANPTSIRLTRRELPRGVGAALRWRSTARDRSSPRRRLMAATRPLRLRW